MTPQKIQSCQQCGNCCREKVIDITFSDILRWSDQKRWDILCEIFYLDNYPVKGQGGFYIEKSAKAPKAPCPFLAQNQCSINDTKPSGCADAPLAYKEFPECPVFKKSSDTVINEMVKKQTQDIMASKRNYNIVMNVLVEARNCQL